MARYGVMLTQTELHQLVRFLDAHEDEITDGWDASVFERIQQELEQLLSLADTDNFDRVLSPDEHAAHLARRASVENP